VSRDKSQLRERLLQRLESDLELARRAAQTAHEAATHEENIAENKYDTLGLEAAYLAVGQSRRVEEIQQALNAWRQLPLHAYDEQRGVGLGTLVQLGDDAGGEQWLLLGPDGAGLKLRDAQGDVLVITARSPLGAALLGQHDGSEFEREIAGRKRRFEVLAAF
jgi:transcription elongation GreA/GreB family factor